MKKRGLLYVIFGLIFYLLFLIIELPAAWFAWGLNRYTQGIVRLDPVAGSLWGGEGKLVIHYPQAVPHDFGQTAWSINPLWLLAGRVQVSLRTNIPDKQIVATLRLTGSSVILKDVDAVVTAAFIAQLYSPMSLISPQGKIRLNTSELVLDRGNIQGTALLEWMGAGSSLSTVQPLGNYRLEITGAGESANFKLSTQQGILQLKGNGEWRQADKHIKFTGEANAQSHEKELEALLQMIGNNVGAGRRSISIDQRLLY